MKLKIISREEVDALEDSLRTYATSYYEGKPLVSDEVYDVLLERLRACKPDSDLLDTIGEADEFEGCEKVPHRMSMHSQAKAKTLEEAKTWFRKRTAADREGNFIVEPKYDGLSLELVYEKGRLVHAITQGQVDGFDLVANLCESPHIPQTIAYRKTVSVRGELIMPLDVFRKKYEPRGYSAPRNTAVGLAKKAGEAGDLHVVCYTVFFGDLPTPRAEREDLEWLRDQGFEVATILYDDRGDKLLENLESVYHIISEKRLVNDPSLTYEMDGLVIKCMIPDLKDLERDTPQRQVALKFPPFGAPTVLRKVLWQASGATYTPVGIVAPVTIGKVNVRRASLCNPSILATLGVTIGAEIYVSRRGDVIPKIEAVLTPGDQPIDVPTECRACATKLRGREGKRLWCPNQECPNLVAHEVRKWIDVLDVKFFGKTLILGLCMRGVVSSIADLYDLSPEQVAEVNLAGLVDEDGIPLDEAEDGKVRKVGLKVATKALGNLVAASKGLPLAKFVAGLDIGSVGVKVAELAVAGVTTIDELLSLDRETLLAVKGLGEKKVAAILRGLVAKEDLIRTLTNHLPGLEFPGGAPAITADRGSVCFTGKMSVPRPQLEALARSAGFEVRSSVSGKLTYLVTNDANSGSAKNTNARAKGIQVIDEAAFRAMLG